MSDKPCNCGGCSNCCDGYVQDPKNANRYVNLESGKERNIEKKEPKVNWLLIWLLIALFTTYYNTPPKQRPSFNQQNQGR
jgi:hypothetical protein